VWLGTLSNHRQSRADRTVSLHHVPPRERGTDCGLGHDQQSQVAFLGEAPATYESSPGARRDFCPRCGTQISFTAAYIPGLIDITIGSLDDPGRVPPALHYWESERLPWVRFADQLPRYPEFPPAEGPATEHGG